VDNDLDGRTAHPMTEPTGIERKVRRLDGDIHAIWAMMSDISAAQRRLGGTLSEISGKILRQGNRLDHIDGRLSELNDQVTTLSAAQGRHDERLDELDEKLDSIIDLLRGRPAT
jgi:hypothetical protein